MELSAGKAVGVSQRREKSSWKLVQEITKGNNRLSLSDEDWKKKSMANTGKYRVVSEKVQLRLNLEWEENYRFLLRSAMPFRRLGD